MRAGIRDREDGVMNPDLVGDAQPLVGGFSGETFLVTAAGEEAVMRIYGRHPERAAVDAALLDLVRGLLPVPRVLEVRPHAPSQRSAGDSSPGTERPPYVLTERLPGERLDRVLPGANAGLIDALADSVGRLLGRLSGMPFRRSGIFTGPDLSVADHPEMPADLIGWVTLHQASGPLSRWVSEDRRGLLGVADDADELLWDVGRVCLVHSDFNPKNLLVDVGSGTVTGLVDWEYAHAGLPYTDVGNLLRFERGPFGDAVFAAYERHTPTPDPHALRRARAADLWALVELASRAGTHVVADQAHELLLTIARAGDLSAAPVRDPSRR
jgi:aminoglycoside phosphotransferase (APT) family kinase protein